METKKEVISLLYLFLCVVLNQKYNLVMCVFGYITFGAFSVFVVFRNRNTFQNPIYLEGAYFNTIYFIYKRSIYGLNLAHQK